MERNFQNFENCNYFQKSNYFEKLFWKIQLPTLQNSIIMTNSIILKNSKSPWNTLECWIMITRSFWFFSKIWVDIFSIWGSLSLFDRNFFGILVLTLVREDLFYKRECWTVISAKKGGTWRLLKGDHYSKLEYLRVLLLINVVKSCLDNMLSALFSSY